MITGGRSVIDDSRTSAVELSVAERARYSRHLVMPEVTMEGQRRLKAARVLCVGAGGLGSPAALYLAAAGVGTIGLVDPDVVDLSNLQRQILHGTADVGRKKLLSARDRIAAVNPHVELELHDCAFRSDNAMAIVEPYDVVIDGSDNFPTRYLSNDVCVFAKKPNVYGSVFRFDGQSTVFAPHLGGPCYRCLFPQPPTAGTVPNCAEAGVLGVVPGIIGMVQAIEAIKLILGLGDSLIGRLLHLDLLQMRFREFRIRRDPQCPVCGEHPTITAPVDYERFCGVESSAAGQEPVPSITVDELQARLAGTEPIRIVDVREQFEYEISRIEGSVLIPLGQLAARTGELEPGRSIALLCKSGVRSAHAVRVLQRAGFGSVYNVDGGIDAWTDEIDPTLQRY